MALVSHGIKETEKTRFWLVPFHTLLFFFNLFSSTSPHSHLAGWLSPSSSHFLFTWHTLISLPFSSVPPLQNISWCYYSGFAMKVFIVTMCFVLSSASCLPCLLRLDIFHLYRVLCNPAPFLTGAQVQNDQNITKNTNKPNNFMTQILPRYKASKSRQVFLGLKTYMAIKYKHLPSYLH